MISITFIDLRGVERRVEAREGTSLMLAAVKNDIAGIEAECGGACACATCHVYIAPEWLAKMPKAEQMEEDMLDFARDVLPQSRLACQIKLSADLDGLIVRVAPS
jgi:ferredoxin, 2Fe-2S